MLNLRNKDDKENWSWVGDITGDGRFIAYYEDGSQKVIDTTMVELAFWDKYKGKQLSEVVDVKDLKWLLKVAGEKGLGFAEAMFKKRLQELT